MFDVCPHCGLYDEAKIIEGDTAICPHCAHRIPFIKRPLYIVTGASGTGKTTLCLHLAHELKSCVCLEMDILWSDLYNTPEDDYRLYRNTWLRLAKNIAQNGRPVLLGGSTTPGQFEACPQARYFQSLHYLALVCEDDVLAERLKARPAWRGSSGENFIAVMQQFNRWFRTNTPHPDYDLTLLDTTPLSIDAALESVTTWFQAKQAG